MLARLVAKETGSDSQRELLLIASFVQRTRITAAELFAADRLHWPERENRVPSGWIGGFLAVLGHLEQAAWESGMAVVSVP